MKSLLFPSLALSIFGCFNLLGLSDNYSLRQFIFLFVGLVVFFVVKKIGFRFFNDNYQLFFFINLILLIYLLLFGKEVRGARRWIELLNFQFQPSEFMKIFFILFFSNLFAKRQLIYNRTFFFGFINFLFLFFLVFRQPDLGTSLVYSFSFFVMILFSPIPKRHLFNLFLLIILSLPFIWNLLADYQRLRIIGFLNPEIDPLGISYNVKQSMITIGSGRLWGKGLGFNTQSRLFFLPENKTDFAFASLVEQFGFFGGFLVIFLFLWLFALITIRLVNSLNVEGGFGCRTIFSLGFLAVIYFQFFVNLGMNLGVFPVTGITLPFISYGGSSLIALFLGLALLPEPNFYEDENQYMMSKLLKK